MKLIFLDIDGVLNSREYDLKRDWSTSSAIDETRLPILKEIVEGTGASIILSSTWRREWERDPSACGKTGKYINRVFAAYGLTVSDKTPDLGYYASREEEIKAYLASLPALPESFIVIDDDVKGWCELSDRLLKTSPYIGRGLEEEHIDLAISMLNVAY